MIPTSPKVDLESRHRSTVGEPEFNVY